MTTETHFFATRSLARAALNASTAESAKLKDFGKDAPAGERWAILVEVASTTVEEMNQSIQQTKDYLTRSSLLADAEKIASLPTGIVSEQVLTTPNNKPCRVSWRRKLIN